MKFATAYDGNPLIAESNTEPSEVMVAGYIPDDLRIMELLLAGQRLEAFKLGTNFQEPDYDFAEGEDVPDDYDGVDEFMDEIEAQELLNQSNRRIQASIDERKQFYSRRLREEDEEKARRSAEKAEPEPTKDEE